MKKLSTFLSVLFIFCFFWVKPAKANVYAAQLTFTNPDNSEFDGNFSDGTGILFTFFLNDTAKSVIIEVKDASNDNVAATIDAGALSKGKRSIAWDGSGTENGKSYYFEITAEQDSYSSSNWKVFYDSGDIDVFTRQADIVKDMKSPLFGLIYAPNDGGPLGRGITIYNPDGSFHDPFLVAADPGDNSLWGIDSPGPAGVFDDLGRFYTVDFDNGEIARLNLDYSLTTVATGFANPKGLAVVGTGTERKIYVCDGNKVVRLNIGDADTFSGFPTTVAEFTDNIYPRHVNFDDAGFMYVSFTVDPSNLDSDGAGLSKFDISGTLPVSSADAILNITGALSHKISDLEFDYGTDRNTNTDDILYYCTRAGSGSSDDGIWRIDDINSSFATILPIILEDSLYDTPDFNVNSRAGIALDAAGNFVLMENSNEHVFFISPPDSDGSTNSFTTQSPDSFTVGGAVSVDEGNIPDGYFLSQNYPNPFNPSTTIRFGLSRASNVDLRIYNSLGEEVAVLIDNEFKSAGSYRINFDAESAKGGLPSGTYIYRLTAGNNIEAKKMILMR